MTEKEEKELRAYCAFLLKEYGFHFSPSDPVIPALYVIHKETEASRLHSKLLMLQVKQAAARISPKVYHFNAPGEARRFQVGMALRWVIAVIPVLVFMALGIWYWSMGQDVQQAKAILDASGPVRELIQLTQKGEDDWLYLEFRQAIGDSIHLYKEYERRDAKTVRVYISRPRKVFPFHQQIF